jgi:hypothetical protein
MRGYDSLIVSVASSQQLIPNAPGSAVQLPTRLVVPLPFIKLQQRAALDGVDCATLAARLLQTIVQDDLCDAVLDQR